MDVGINEASTSKQYCEPRTSRQETRRCEVTYDTTQDRYNERLVTIHKMKHRLVTLINETTRHIHDTEDEDR